MNDRYTPGPWITCVFDNCFEVCPASRPGQIATILKDGINAADASGNAYLINAAPDMLAVLRDLIVLEANSKASKKNPNTTFIDTRDWQAFVSSARATIAKATGGEA